MTKEALFAEGLLKVKENDHHASVAIFSQVLEIDPKDANALSQRAVAYLNLEEYELSMADMNLAVEYDPEYGYRYQCRAYLKTRLKDHEGAIADYQKAVDLDPKDSIAYNNLALAQEQMGWAGQAKANFNKSDTIAGIQTAEERSKARLEAAEREALKSKKTTNTKQSKKGDVAKDVFRKKSSFKEFLRFVGNGFKLKENDES